MPLTKSQLHGALAEQLGRKLGRDVPKKEIATFFEVYQELIRKELRKPEGKVNAIPGLLTLVKKNVKAKPAREGRSPFTGETMMFKAKPASKSVRASIRKGLKEMVL